MAVSASDSPAGHAPAHAGFAFPAQLQWHSTAPRSVADAAAWEAGDDGWKAWKKHLANRRKPRPLARLVRSHGPLAWCLPEPDASGRDLRRLLKRLPRKSGQTAGAGPWEAELTAWLAAERQPHLDLPTVMAALGWCHALPSLAGRVQPQLWWASLSRLVELSAEPTGLDTALPPLVWQLAAAELPLTLAYLFPEITACRRLAAQGRQALVAGMEELLDGHGLPRFQHLDSLLPLLACWTRIQAMAEKTPEADWPPSAERQFAELVRHAVRLSRVDGALTFTGQPLDAELLHAAARQTGCGRVKRLVRAWEAEVGKVPGRFEAGGGNWSAKRKNPAMHSEWSDVALLRRDWSPASPRLAVGYSGRTLVCEAAAGRHVLFSGPCQPQIRSAGRLLEPASGWEEVCWVSDEDGDYVELEMLLENSVRVQRQIFLARRDLFLFSADTILAGEAMPLEYEVSFPLGPDLNSLVAEETNEAWLAAKKPQAAVLPFALGEWRSDSRAGQLTFSDGQLRLRQSTPSGRGLFAPLWFDLNRSRLGLPLTWRRLTVAENRENQPADAAVGYRVQVGRQNWLIYRSFTGAANRTLLGHHLLTQFLIGQFTAAGEVLTLIEIE
ncbi:MAG TPA: hypothetical protein VHV55_20465 [Pirellulales bacterium]|jgi:hypothetical protein|nr:hypothetical protein [Pirellulales bacterium]